MHLTKTVRIGGISIGGDAPVAIQSMTNTKTADRESTLAQILALEEEGCDIVRFTVNTPEAAGSIPYLAERTHIPLVADIHFDYKLALAAADAGISKIRINPGNIGSEEHIRAVAKKCIEKNIPVRIGINSGSLEKHILEKYGSPTAEALCESALEAAAQFEKYDFDNLVLSVKSSSVQTMIAANRLLSERCSYPLHLGVTETGTLRNGLIKSSVGIGSLLCDGIGATVRVSLTADPVEEVRAAKDILSACGKRACVNLISCPTCGRTEIDLIPCAEKLQEIFRSMKTTRPVTVALMGCIVNGPGEAREADVGVAGGKKEALLFRKGEIIRKIREEEIVTVLTEEVRRLIAESEKRNG